MKPKIELPIVPATNNKAQGTNKNPGDVTL